LPAESDALSAALRTIKLRALINLTLDASGSWAIDFPGLEGFTFTVVQKASAGWR
jgi:hypothetical protein